MRQLRLKSEAELPAAVRRRLRDTTGPGDAAKRAARYKDSPNFTERHAKLAAPATPKADPHVELLLSQLMALNMAAPVPEYPLVSDRKFRLDLAFPEILVAIEIDSMVHRTKERFLSDMEKYNIAAQLGWRIFRVLPKHVRSGEAAKTIAVWLLTTPAGRGGLVVPHCKI